MRILVIVMLMILSLNLLAQEREPFRTPQIGPHNFVVNPDVNPFNLTQFEMAVGLAQTDFNFSPLSLPDTVLEGIDGELVFVSTNFRFRHKIRDWVGFYWNTNISTRVGTELESFLSQGVNTLIGVNLGWLFRIKQNDRLLLNGLVELRNEDANVVNFSKFLEDLIDGNPNASISDGVIALTGGVGFEGAYAISQLFGLIGSVKVNYGESFSRGDSRWLYQVAFGGDINLYEKYNVPLGLSTAFNLSSIPSFVVEDEFSTILTTKIAYTGANDFQLGVVLVSGKVPLPGVSDKAAFEGATLVATYYFR